METHAKSQDDKKISNIFIIKTFIKILFILLLIKFLVFAKHGIGNYATDLIDNFTNQEYSAKDFMEYFTFEDFMSSKASVSELLSTGETDEMELVCQEPPSWERISNGDYGQVGVMAQTSEISWN